MDRDWHLPLTRQSLLFQFVKQTGFIRAFEQTWTESRVDFYCRADQRGSNLVFSHPPYPLRDLRALCDKAFCFRSRQELADFRQQLARAERLGDIPVASGGAGF